MDWQQKLSALCELFNDGLNFQECAFYLKQSDVSTEDLIAIIFHLVYEKGEEE